MTTYFIKGNQACQYAICKRADVYLVNKVDKIIKSKSII